MPEQDDLFVAAHALERGLIARPQLLETLYGMARSWSRGEALRPLGTVLLERGHLSLLQLKDIVSSMAVPGLIPREATSTDSSKLGQLLVASGLVTHAHIQEALRYQQQCAEQGLPRIRIGEYLVSMGYTTPQAIQRALSYQRKAIYSCEDCGTQYNLVNARADLVYPCPRCRGKLRHEPDTIRVSGGTIVEQGEDFSASQDPVTPAPFRAEDISISRIQADRSLGLSLCAAGRLSESAWRDAEHWQVEIAQFGLYAPLAEVLRHLGAVAEPADAPAAPAGSPRIPGYQITGWLAMSPSVALYAVQPQFTPGAATVTALHADLSSDAARVQRFQRNAALLKRLEHPRLLKAYEYGSISFPGSADARVHYMSGQYIHGRALSQVLRVRGRFSPTQALSITADLASALTYLHREGFVHGHLDADRILIDERSRAWLSDVSDAAACERPAKEDPRASEDIYQLGLILRDMIVGPARPGRPAPHVDDIRAPEELKEVLRIMLDPDPARRHQYFASVLSLRGAPLEDTVP